MFRFNKTYFLLAIVLFIVEVLIALYVDDAIIRPYLGDLLVVILMYSFVRAFTQFAVLAVAISVLLFAYLIEILQYFQLVHRLGLGQYPLARIVIGSTFQWIDLVAYTAGIAIVLWVEQKRGIDLRRAGS
ncbi:DUF2809 domain-containing protein [Paraflavitalea pollutisoli]|uniref:ribosomal maturation YjgA family protein n=1 Tax=Paraflavitalea pollutisoli TaxID=3034143 RepID=UPI0023EDA7E8|nr:DUF2809 domain-containing protein [Paraflavitalea sp. H1-2-19X]